LEIKDRPSVDLSLSENEFLVLEQIFERLFAQSKLNDCVTRIVEGTCGKRCWVVDLQWRYKNQCEKFVVDEYFIHQINIVDIYPLVVSLNGQIPSSYVHHNMATLNLVFREYQLHPDFTQIRLINHLSSNSFIYEIIPYSIRSSGSPIVLPSNSDLDQRFIVKINTDPNKSEKEISVLKHIYEGVISDKGDAISDQDAIASSPIGYVLATLHHGDFTRFNSSFGIAAHWQIKKTGQNTELRKIYSIVRIFRQKLLPFLF
jgi:hypothetical protein